MAEKILVTGINGFVGKHLARELHKKGFIVDGLTKNPGIDPEIENIVNYNLTCDLTEVVQVQKLDLSQYMSIINLAGLANVGESFKHADLYMLVNVSVLSNICERVQRQALTTRIIAVSSGAVYDSNQAMPLLESSALTDKGSPYALSKIKMEHEAHRYRELGVNCIIARPFNHIGPGQLMGFLVPDLISRAKAVLNNHQPIKVGNLETRRDYTDVRDVASAYVRLATADLKRHTYNICSGKSVSGKEILSLILDNMRQKDLKTQTDVTIFRPSDFPEIYGSNQRLVEETGWQRQYTLEKTIADIVAAEHLN